MTCSFAFYYDLQLVIAPLGFQLRSMFIFALRSGLWEPGDEFNSHRQKEAWPCRGSPITQCYFKVSSTKSEKLFLVSFF